MTDDARCFVCGARDWRDEAVETTRCGHCGTRVATPYDPDHCLPELAKAMREGRVDLARGGRPFFMDAYTFRSAAIGYGLEFEPGDLAQAAALAHPHSSRPASGTLRRAGHVPPRVGFAMIARADEARDFLSRFGAIRDRFVDAVVVVDAGLNTMPASDAARIVSRPLAADFAAQRNAAQALVRAPWVLQLDTDEWPDDALLDAMDALTAMADRQSVASIGFKRRNLVDGHATDLWPDIQYRLNRRELAYAGRVHERPKLDGAWRRGMIATRGVIEHCLDGERVRSRTLRYGAMKEGADRLGDEKALLRPFRP